jgi:prepilin-type N-terminal cleavage/methylation domain-containing protein
MGNSRYNQGFTLIELLAVVAIIGVLVAVVISSLSTFRSRQALKNTTDDIISLINDARVKTISSVNSTNYGVHIESARLVEFSGATFVNGSSSNRQIDIDSSVTIPSSGGINLSGGGSDVIFTRLSGDTSNYGTIVVQLSSNSSVKKTITINQTGVVSVN